MKPLEANTPPGSDAQKPPVNQELLTTSPVEEKPKVVESAPEYQPPRDASGLRLDGPTLSEYVARGYDAITYPPHGYAVKEEPVTAPAETPKNGKPKLSYFKKVLANMPLYVRGNRVELDMLSANTAVIAPPAGSELDQELTKLARANKGGVVAIDEATYDELKKKLALTNFPQRLQKPRLRAFELNPFNKRNPQPKPSPKDAAPAVAADSSPSTGRVGPVGGGSGTGVAGKSASDPAVPFKPSTGPKTPLTKKPTGASLSGGVPDPDA